MLSIEKCKEILVNSEIKYTDEQIKVIREYLYKLAALAKNEILRKRHEKGNYIYKSVNR